MPADICLSPHDRYFTPPTLAWRWGVAPEKIVAWIKTGELRGIDLSAGTQRPRYRISPEAVAAFELRRAAKPAPRPRRKRRPAPVTGLWFA